MSNPYTYQQRKTSTFVLIILIFLLLLYALKGFITSFFGALIIYTLFRTWHGQLVEEKKWKSIRSSLLMMLISFLMIILPIGLMVYQVATQVVKLSKNPSLFSQMFNNILQHPLYKKYADPGMLQDQLSQAGQYAVGLFSSTLNGLATAVATIGVMYLILFFMFADYKTMEQWVVKYIPFSTKNTLLFSEELRNITYSNVIGQGILSVVQGTLVGIGFWIFGVPQPLLYGTIAIFASFLPVVGSALVFVPGSIYAFSTGNTFGGVALLLWGFGLVANIDNVLRIFINKRMGDTHPLVTFLGIIVGIPLFGLTGLVIGPLIISFFILLIKIYTTNYLNEEESQPQEAVKEEASPTTTLSDQQQ